MTSTRYTDCDTHGSAPVDDVGGGCAFCANARTRSALLATEPTPAHDVREDTGRTPTRDLRPYRRDHCLAHERYFRIDAYGDARHGDGSRCSGSLTVRLAWRSVDGAGSEDAPDLTERDAVEYVRMTNDELRAHPDRNPWGYVYGARVSGRKLI